MTDFSRLLFKYKYNSAHAKSEANPLKIIVDFASQKLKDELVLEKESCQC